MDNTKAPLKSGMEKDALTRNKKYFRWNAGIRKEVKRAYNKRNRKYANQKIRHEIMEGERYQKPWNRRDEPLDTLRNVVYPMYMDNYYEIQPSFGSLFDVVCIDQATGESRIVGTYKYEIAKHVADALNNEAYLESKR